MSRFKSQLQNLLLVINVIAVLSACGVETKVESDGITRDAEVSDGSSGGPSNSTPVASNFDTSTSVNGAVTFNPLENDLGLDDTPITLTISSSPSNGTTTISSYSITYTPNADFVGPDSFVYQVTDKDGEADTATVTIQVNGSNTPFAVDDSASTLINTALSIDVLTNDTGISDMPVSVSIFSAASQGTASVGPNNSIDYAPNNNFVGNDSFVYKITDVDGDIATATVSVQVDCASCAAGVTIDLAWDQNSDTVNGYEVYFAASTLMADATTLVDIISILASGFDPAAPSLSLDAWNDLGLYIGDSVCFRLKAYNSVGKSGYSAGVCGTVPG